MKKNDIFYAKHERKDSIIYVTQVVDEAVDYAIITIHTCSCSTLTCSDFDSRYRDRIMLDNKEIEIMEIMNITDDYPEFFI